MEKSKSSTAQTAHLPMLEQAAHNTSQDTKEEQAHAKLIVSQPKELPNLNDIDKEIRLKESDAEIRQNELEAKRHKTMRNLIILFGVFGIISTIIAYLTMLK